MSPPSGPAIGEDAAKLITIAAALLFTTEPSDRALEGWDGAGEAVEEIAVIRGFTSAATEGMR